MGYTVFELLIIFLDRLMIIWGKRIKVSWYLRQSASTNDLRKTGKGNCGKM